MTQCSRYYFTSNLESMIGTELVIQYSEQTKQIQGRGSIMKFNFIPTTIFAAVFSLAGGMASTDAQAAEPQVVDVQFNKSYIPRGFDSNDNGQIVAEGTLPNTCYKPAQTEVVIDHAQKTVTLFAKARKYEGICLPVLVNYHRVIDLGVMNVGEYRVLQGSANLGKLQIAAATSSSADDFLYAPISQAYFEKVDQYHQVKISGEFKNSCMKLVDVLFNIEDDVIVLQPISELEDGEACAEGTFPFESAVILENLPAGRYLLHIRSLNAKAVNSLVNAR